MPRPASLSPVLALVLAFPAASAAQTTWHVDANSAGCPGSGTAGDPFCTIGAALAAASPGDTIQVAAGLYVEKIQITKDDLHLVGAGADVTTISSPENTTVILTAGDGQAPTGSIEGFRITSTGSLLSTIGIAVNPQLTVDPNWRISRCLVEGVARGIQLADSYDPDAELVVEDTVITHCKEGINIFGLGAEIRRCTISDIAGVGVFGGYPNTKFVLSDSIIAGTDWWAVEKYWNAQVTIERVLVHDNNLAGPGFCTSCGPFVMFLAEENGVYSPFTPLPGPVVTANPLFVNPAGGDWRLLKGSPAIDVGDPAIVPDAGEFDALGFGHPRVDDGDFDGASRLDLGAIEFGGLITNAGLHGTLTVGQTLVLTQWGQPGALRALLLGLPGAPLDLGDKGFLFLATSPLVVLSVGTLPPSGASVVLSGVLPPASAGLTIHLQALQKAGALHWTNLERIHVEL